jgi:hypothetical protein
MAKQPREKDRYQRESLLEQILDEIRGARHHPRVLLVLAFMFGAGVILFLLQAPVVKLEDLAAGDCIYIPTPSGGKVDSPRAIGTQAEAAAGLVLAGAERAECSKSHSHEVAATFRYPDPSGTPYPYANDLWGGQRSTCEAAFVSYVGHAIAGSQYELTIVWPTKDAWDAGRRAGACLVSRADGTFMSGPAHASGL